MHVNKITDQISVPTSVATYERARRLANVSVWTIALQCRRLQSSEPEDGDFVFRKWADFDFLIVALKRLRRAADIANKVPEIKQIIKPALKKFDSAFPHLTKMRDVAEHIDEYAFDKGKHPVRRQELEVSILNESDNGLTLDWLGHNLNTKDALRESRKLFDAIRNASVAVPKHPNSELTNSSSSLQ